MVFAFGAILKDFTVSGGNTVVLMLPFNAHRYWCYEDGPKMITAALVIVMVRVGGIVPRPLQQ